MWSAVSAHAQVLVMTYAESFAVAKAMGFTETASWKTGVKTGKPGYSLTTMTVGGRLHRLCIPAPGHAGTVAVARNRLIIGLHRGDDYPAR